MLGSSGRAALTICDQFFLPNVLEGFRAPKGCKPVERTFPYLANLSVFFRDKIFRESVRNVIVNLFSQRRRFLVSPPAVFSPPLCLPPPPTKRGAFPVGSSSQITVLMSSSQCLSAEMFSLLQSARLHSRHPALIWSKLFYSKNIDWASATCWPSWHVAHVALG